MGRIFKRSLKSLGWAWGLAVLASSLRIRSVCSSQFAISRTFMEISLKLIYFTDFNFIEISTSLFSFFQGLFFHLHCCLKLTLFRRQNYHEFSRFFFFMTNCIVCIVSETFMTWILVRTSKFKPTTRHFWRSTWLTHFDGPCNYLYSCQKQPAGLFLWISTAASLITEKLAIAPAYLLKLRSILDVFLLPRRHFLFKSS